MYQVSHNISTESIPILVYDTSASSKHLDHRTPLAPSNNVVSTNLFEAMPFYHDVREKSIHSSCEQRRTTHTSLGDERR